MFFQKYTNNQYKFFKLYSTLCFCQLQHCHGWFHIKKYWLYKLYFRIILKKNHKCYHLTSNRINIKCRTAKMTNNNSIVTDNNLNLCTKVLHQWQKKYTVNILFSFCSQNKRRVSAPIWYPRTPHLPLPVLLLQFLLSLNFSRCASLRLSNSSQTDASPELQSCGVEVMKATSRVPLQDPSSSSASANSLI